MTLAALGNSALVGELVIADGGSRDDTGVATARASGARIVMRRCAAGRGAQLAAGAAAAEGDWLLFMHADCRPLPGWEDAVQAFISASTGEAGYFALALDDRRAGGAASGAPCLPGALPNAGAALWRHQGAC